MTQENEKALLALFGEETEETTEQTATEQNAGEKSEIPTNLDEVAEESSDDAEESTEESVEEIEEEPTEESAEENKEPKEEKLTAFQQKILANLNRRVAEGDTLLATAMQSKDKNIQDCTKYLNEKAKQTIEKGARQGAVCVQIDDDEVYGWAHHYYIESKETIEKEIPAMKPYVAPKNTHKPTPKTAEQKKAEETAKKVHENPLLASLMKRGAKISNDGEVAVVKTTERKDEQGNILSSKTTKTDEHGNRTTTLTKNGQTFTMTEFSLF